MIEKEENGERAAIASFYRALPRETEKSKVGLSPASGMVRRERVASAG